ncbi:hypothetical protein SARC_02447 [Sphaeroforma arctica JP610]|uniref:Peptidyl-prolyl cis-trans isomerase n=1 Tax=Sphaeroforma arctica JP610 TaxID=667725 RepID=A0A0L0G8L9_9EUKA|nr:hypothetical protein SARC_02447 [Sphaeroforma arctica JP610]KNC85355.1 hypothetical protein SARC_02447 [Sphaeroforma arctica JP610]|eukprot:XP_014159257.1 hypothetical protein SARC_02447 [Sphaeroforma arctica JP610]
MSVLIETSKGDITVDLYTDDAPKACLNFLKLCKIKYYNYCLFHDVQSNFILQTGDPSGTGKGGQSLFGLMGGQEYFEDEIKSNLRFTRSGLLAMANTGKDTNASQFFFTAGDRLDSIDGKYTIFGEVVDDDDESMKTLWAINEAYVDSEGRPYQDIRIRHTIVLDDPFDDPRELRVPSRSPSPTPEQMQSGRIGENAVIDETEGMTDEQIEAMKREREAKAGAQILAMIGDMPDEDVKPPDNVLFVCKLNPVTTDEDLELIFSRFGTIVSNEIIRDRKTGDSLGYAFVEFEEREQCEAAYLKMENVLIDDRRIHVDFSQSVSKLWRQTATKSMPAGAGGGVKYTIKSDQRQDGKQYGYVFNDDDLQRTAYNESSQRAIENPEISEAKKDRNSKRTEESAGTARHSVKGRDRSRDRGSENKRKDNRRSRSRSTSRGRGMANRESRGGHDRKGRSAIVVRARSSDMGTHRDKDRDRARGRDRRDSKDRGRHRDTRGRETESERNNRSDRKRNGQLETRGKGGRRTKRDTDRPR